MSKSTIYFNNAPTILSAYTVVGPKESEGIIGRYADVTLPDDTFGENTYEKAECKMLSAAIGGAIKKAGLKESDIDVIVSGDLLNQIISSSFAARDYPVSFLGVYGACSTMAEAFLVSACLVDSGYIDYALAATGSHFSSAERQYRFPLEQGTTRPPQSQWTVTGAGGAVIAKNKGGVKITSATIGKVTDFGITDVNNMGAAMAPAAADTILTHLKDTGRSADYYDIILTGDLGAFGSRIVKELTLKEICPLITSTAERLFIR